VEAKGGRICGTAAAEEAAIPEGAGYELHVSFMFREASIAVGIVTIRIQGIIIIAYAGNGWDMHHLIGIEAS
jgi:hypothetical protein